MGSIGGGVTSAFLRTGLEVFLMSRFAENVPKYLLSQLNSPAHPSPPQGTPPSA